MGKFAFVGIALLGALMQLAFAEEKNDHKDVEVVVVKEKPLMEKNFCKKGCGQGKCVADKELRKKCAEECNADINAACNTKVKQHRKKERVVVKEEKIYVPQPAPQTVYVPKSPPVVVHEYIDPFPPVIFGGWGWDGHHHRHHH